MAVTPIIDTVLDYLKDTRLASITTANSYNNTVKRVSRRYYDLEEVTTQMLPLLCVLDNDITTFTPLTNQEFTTGRQDQSITDGHPINVIGYTDIYNDESDDGEISKALGKLYADIVTCIHADITLNNLVLSCILDSVAKSYAISEEKNLGIVIVRFMLKYDFQPGKAPITV